VTPTLIVHYQELVLKGRNRPWFVDRLVRNLREVTAGLGVAEVRPIMGRIELRLRAGTTVDDVVDRVERTPGVASVSLADRTAASLEAMERSALQLGAGRTPSSFRVAAIRADKSFPLTSPEVERAVGARICETYGWRVDLARPDLVVRVEIVPGAAYVSVDRRRGPAGLPVGVSGRVACLLSGGIDSPVAAFRLMRRGCRVVFVHFHSYPLTSDATREKARALVRILAHYQLRARLVLVPFADLQRQVVVSVPAALRVVVYRRFMMRITERIARRASARALVTGEVIGQVASQTLENLSAIDAVVSMPVLRPLIGMDKEDIVAEARRIGTFDVSIRAGEDCCQVLVPRHPAINVSRLAAERAEADLPVDALVRDAVARVEREMYRWSDRPSA
jgi:thiamine biosynthesis protein ThiI